MEKNIKKSIKKIGSKKLLILIFSIFFLLYFIRTSFFVDPDFGYRLKNGERIVKFGFDSIKHDPYSYTMEGYRFVEHSSLSAIVFYLIYSNFGYLALSFVYSLMSLLAIYTMFDKRLSLKSTTLNRYYPLTNVFFILSYIYLFGFVGIRVQVASWLFFALTYSLLTRKDLEKYKIFLPGLFLIWVNVHGGFVIGLVLVIFDYFLKAFNIDKISNLKEVLRAKINFSFSKKDNLLLTFCFLATFINPYNIDIYKKVFGVFSDSSLRWKIAEWRPGFMSFEPAVLIFLTISLYFIYRYKSNFKIFSVGVFFLTLIQGILAMRQLPFFVLASIPIALKSNELFVKEIRKVPMALGRYKKAMYVFLYFSISLLILQSVYHISTGIKVSESNFYPKEAVKYLKTLDFDSEVFSTYNWGGYLIWKYPEKKVFVSGLMPSWRSDSPSEKMLSSSFETHTKLVSGQIEKDSLFERFNIEVVLWESKKLREKKQGIGRFFSDFLEKKGLKEKGYDFICNLEKSGWEKIYYDDISEIYIKK